MKPNPFIVRPSGLIGYKHTETKLWSGTDQEDVYNKNLEQFPNHPDLLRYVDNPIRYEYNIQGHRTCDITHITNSKKPYILVTGCSFTEGTGLHRHETYAELLAKKAQLPVYNLGLAGTGIDIMVHNLMAWQAFIRPAPKILVVQWSQRSRTCAIPPPYEDHGILGSIFAGPLTSESVNHFIDGGNECNAFNTRAFLADRLIKAVYKTSEIINVHVPSWESEEYGNSKRIVWMPENKEPNFARDLGHRGTNCHDELSDRILKFF